MNGSDRSPWHPGEQTIQAQAGVADKMVDVGRKVIRDFMPEQHRELFGRLPMLFIGAEDGHGDLWASALFGPPGFIAAQDPRTLTFETTLNRFDPLAAALEPGRDVGLLGIEPETRRRNRANGAVTSDSQGRLSVTVRQSFGNCPKYIQVRERSDNPCFGDFQSTEFTTFDPDIGRSITAADTCFVASLFDDGNDRSSRGVDVSHRGGLPGFILVNTENTLLIPDYSGNNFFNTLGNILRDERVGLLFPDFARGHLMYLTGAAKIIQAGDEPIPFRGVERMIRFQLARGRLVRNATPWRWTLRETSPFCLRYPIGSTELPF